MRRSGETCPGAWYGELTDVTWGAWASSPSTLSTWGRTASIPPSARTARVSVSPSWLGKCFLIRSWAWEDSALPPEKSLSAGAANVKPTARTAAAPTIQTAAGPGACGDNRNGPAARAVRRTWGSPRERFNGVPRVTANPGVARQPGDDTQEAAVLPGAYGGSGSVRSPSSAGRSRSRRPRGPEPTPGGADAGGSGVRGHPRTGRRADAARPVAAPGTGRSRAGRRAVRRALTPSRPGGGRTP